MSPRDTVIFLFESKVFPYTAYALSLLAPAIIYCFRYKYLGHNFPFYWVLPVAFLGLLAQTQSVWNNALRDSRQFILPFLPWILVCCVLPFFQPIAYRPEQQLLPFATAVILFICLHPIRANISRLFIVFICALSNIAICSVICWFFFKGDIRAVDVLLNINCNCLLGGLLILLPLSFVGMTYYWKEHRPLGVFCLLSSSLGFLGIAFLQARTGIVGLFSLFLCVFFIRKAHRIKFSLGLALLLVVLIAYFIHTGRLEQGFSNLRDWWAGIANTSWGIRLSLWKSSVYGLLVHPWVGWGKDPLGQILASGVTTLPFAWSGSTHFHGDFFHALASFGLLGGAAWISMQYLLIRVCKHDPFRLVMLVSLLLGGLSEVYWPFCKYSCYSFFMLWPLLTLADTRETQPKQISQSSAKGHYLGSLHLLEKTIFQVKRFPTAIKDKWLEVAGWIYRFLPCARKSKNEHPQDKSKQQPNKRLSRQKKPDSPNSPLDSSQVVRGRKSKRSPAQKTKELIL